ncbi:MAG: VOC family protein [Bacteroidota bacterium]
MSIRFDHVVHVVKDLPQACKDFESQGFTVTPGGNHYKGISKNALIFFQDGTFLELLTLRSSLNAKLIRLFHKTKVFKKWQYSPKYGVAYRFYNRAIEQPDGVTDFCLLVDDSRAEYDRIQAEGIFLTNVLNAGRKKPDGSKVAWDMYAPYIADLPFLRSNYTPSAPLPESATTHTNGITGMSAIHQLALDFKDSTNKYTSLLGKAPSFHDSKLTTFEEDGFEYHIYRASSHPDLQKQLSGKGIGLYGLTFKGGDPSKLDLSKLHGLQVVS